MRKRRKALHAERERTFNSTPTELNRPARRRTPIVDKRRVRNERSGKKGNFAPSFDASPIEKAKRRFPKRTVKRSETKGPARRNANVRRERQKQRQTANRQDRDRYCFCPLKIKKFKFKQTSLYLNLRNASFSIKYIAFPGFRKGESFLFFILIKVGLKRLI